MNKLATHKVSQAIVALSDHIKETIERGFCDNEELARLTDSLANLVSSQKAVILSPLMVDNVERGMRKCERCRRFKLSLPMDIHKSICNDCAQQIKDMAD